jgi:hypothetical protein
MQRGQAVETQYFGQQNQQQLFTVLAQDFQQKQGQLTEKQQVRLGKTLDHYMREVWDTNGPMPIPQLNREALGATAKDFTGYLRRDAQMPSTAASQTIVSDSRNQPRMEMAMLTQRPTFEQALLQDTGSRFEQLQQERIGPAEARPAPPDFQISLSAAADEPSALSLYESAKKAREQEAARQERDKSVTTLVSPAQTDVNPLMRFMSPPSIQNDPNANPTLALPMTPAPRGPLQQDFIIRQDDIISYKETEYNLIIYSADRDWLNNTRETRYNFSVNFDPANNQQGFNYSPSSNKKFKNISRIELVKAILPTEGLDTLVIQSSGTTNTTSKLNALSFPYIIVRIPELDNNNFGTDTYLDNSFGVLQYDANWYTDTTNLTDGYLAMIPKFMKCQKSYTPTPLATLTKLSIEMQRPDGTPLSAIADTLSISRIFIGGTGPNALPTGYLSALYDDNSGYLFLVTSTYFSQWTFAQGNRIQIRGLDASQITGGTTQAGIDLVQYLQSNSLPIAGIANSGTSPGDGPNTVGYANIIIVRTSHDDPTTGSTAINYFGGGSVAYDALGVSLKTTTFTSGKLINLTHQTNLVLRIITRELDPTARVRPDNL